MANAPANEGLDDEPLDLGPGTAEEEGNDEPEVVIVEDEAEETEEVVEAEADPEEVEASDEKPDEEDLAPDDKKLSLNVQDRIKREVRLRKRAVAEAEGRAQSESIARRAAEQRALEYEVAMAGMADVALTAQIKQVKDELKAAMEAGETDKQIEATEKLNDLQAKHRNVQGGKESATERLEKMKAAPVRPADGLRPITREWMGRNKWFGSEGFEAQTAAARAIDAKLGKEGFDPGTPEFYQEFDRRIHRELPNLRQRVKAMPGAEKPSKPIVGAVRQAPSKPAGRPGTITLTRSQLANMKSFGLDPTDKKQLIAYAQNVGAQS